MILAFLIYKFPVSVKFHDRKLAYNCYSASISTPLLHFEKSWVPL